MTFLADLARAGFVLDADTHSSIVGPQPPQAEPCSRCERPAVSVSRDGLCDACAELLLCIANEVERDGDDWWGAA